MTRKIDPAALDALIAVLEENGAEATAKRRVAAVEFRDGDFDRENYRTLVAAKREEQAFGKAVDALKTVRDYLGEGP